MVTRMSMGTNFQRIKLYTAIGRNKGGKYLRLLLWRTFARKQVWYSLAHRIFCTFQTQGQVT